MVEPVGQNINIRLKGTDIQLNENTLKGTVISKKTPIFMKNFDKNNDGAINGKEAKAMLKELKKAADNDVLTEKEFEKAKLGNKSEFNSIADAVKKTVGTTTEKDDDKITTTVRKQDGTCIRTVEYPSLKIKDVFNYDADGNVVSQTAQTPDGFRKLSFKYDKNGNLKTVKTINKDINNNIINSNKTEYTYDEAGRLLGANITKFDKSGKPTGRENIKYETNADNQITKMTTTRTKTSGEVEEKSVETRSYKNGKLSNVVISAKNASGIVVTTKKYAADGRTVQSVTQDTKNNDGTSSHIEQKQNEQGKVKTKSVVTRDADGNITRNTNMNFEYSSDGKTLLKISESGTKNDTPVSESVKYDNSGNLVSIDCTRYKRGAKLEEHYEGANLNNRRNYIPSKTIEYEADGKTVKSITLNKFDKDGVLISEETRDKNGNVVSTHDFSKLDGKFDTSYQKARGDCYLLAGVNALNASTAGQEALKKVITTGKDPKTGETTYTVTFPGAKQARDELIAQGIPEDKIDIKESYTYTEAQIHEKAKLAGSHYSAGDKDVLLLEVAYEQYRTDAKADIEDLKAANPKLIDIQAMEKLHILGMEGSPENDNLSSGCESDAMFLLTGKKGEEYVHVLPDQSKIPICEIDSDFNIKITGTPYELTEEQNAKIDAIFAKIEQDCKDGSLDDYSATVGINVSSQTVNGKVEYGGGHALSITKIEGDKVYLKNPWEPTKETVMTKDEIKKIAKNVSLVNLKENTQDETSGSDPVNPSDDTTQTTETPQAGKGYKVPQGKGYKTLLKEALIAQGIEPTAENIQKASEQFKAKNEGAVHIYSGKNKKYHGNEFLYMDDIVTIPKFEI